MDIFKKHHTKALCFVILLIATCTTNSLANPSAYPENGLAFSVGYDHVSNSFEGAISGEWLLPVSILDMSVGLELAKDSWDTPFELGVTFNTLVLPAWGNDPPLAVGFATDIHYEHNNDIRMVFGPLIGTDLLFNPDIQYPITLSAFWGVGVENPHIDPTNIIMAWSAYVRYYFDDIDLAVELTTDSERLIGLGLRYVFY